MKLTKEYLESMVVGSSYFYDGTLTICSLLLTNGAQVVGQSNVIDPNTFNRELGEKFAYEDAIDKLWQLEGYAVKTRGK